MRHWNILGMVGLLCMAGAATAAGAVATYNWSISGSGFSGSGKFTVEDTPYAGAKDAPFADQVAYLVTDISGKIGNRTISGLLAPDPDYAAYGNDNLFYPLAAYPRIDQSGLAFRAGSFNYALFYSQVCGVVGANTQVCNDRALFYVDGASQSRVVTFTVTPASAVPEPATWATMLAGLAMAGGALRRRTRWTHAI